MSPWLLIPAIVAGAVIVGVTVVFFLKARFRESIEAPELRNLASAAAPVPVAEEVRAIGDQIEKAMSEQRLQGETQRQLLSQKLDSVRQTIDAQRTHVEGLRSEFRHESRRRDAEMAEVRAQIGSLHDAVGLPPAAHPQAALPPAPEPEPTPEPSALADGPLDAEPDAPAFASGFADLAPADAPPLEMATAEPEAPATPPSPFEPVPYAPMADAPAEPELTWTPEPTLAAEVPLALDTFAEVSFAPPEPPAVPDAPAATREAEAPAEPASDEFAFEAPADRFAEADPFAEMAFGAQESAAQAGPVVPREPTAPTEPPDPFAYAPLTLPGGDGTLSEPSVFESWAPEPAPSPAAPPDGPAGPATAPAAEVPMPPAPPSHEPLAASAETTGVAPDEGTPSASSEPETFAPVTFDLHSAPEPAAPAESAFPSAFEPVTTLPQEATPTEEAVPLLERTPEPADVAPAAAPDASPPAPAAASVWIARSDRADAEDTPVTASADEFLSAVPAVAPVPAAPATPTVQADDLIDLNALDGPPPSAAPTSPEPMRAAMPGPTAVPPPPETRTPSAAPATPAEPVAAGPRTVHQAAPSPEVPAAPSADAEPAPLPEGADDLTVITTIDEDVQRLLYQAGVTTLEEIAQWGRGDARRISAAVQVAEDTVMNSWVFEAQAALYSRYSSQAAS